MEKERCYASHNLGGTESKPKAKRKLLERRSILGPLLGEVLGSCKSGTGGTGRSNCYELLSSLPGSEGAGEVPGSPSTCLSVRGPEGLALDSEGMSGPRWSGLGHRPPGHEPVAEELPWIWVSTHFLFLFSPVF